MKARTLSRLLVDGRRSAEANHLESARDVYLRSIERMAVAAHSSFTAITAAAWQPPPDGAILTALALQKIASRLNGELESIWMSVVLDVPGAALARAEISWDVAHPLAQGLLDAAVQRTGAALGAAIQPVLRKAIGDAYMNGLSVRDTAAAIRSAITDAAPWQAEMLARTDLNSLANGASHAAARLVGVGFKTWDATLDDRTRLTHADAHGQTVPLNAPFDVGGEALDYPGDPNGSDEETINCRCTLVYANTLAEGEALLADGGGTMHEMTTGRGAAKIGSRVARASENFRGGKGLAAAAIPQVTWVSDLAFEGAATGDGRYILPNALTTRELPLTLMAQTVTDDGHDGAFVAGRIDKVSRSSKNIDGDTLADGVKSFHATGVFDMGGANGAEVARLVGDETVRGVSIDMAVLDWAIRDPKTGELIEPQDATPEQMDAFFFGELEMAIRKGEIMAATVCATPAFANARIALAASANGERVLRIWMPLRVKLEVGLIASAAPAKPPRQWFETQEPPGKMPLTITDEGRVFGHLADWSSCHLSFLPACVPPPRSASNYAYFHAGEVETAEGDRIAVGKLMVGGRHDNNLSHSREEAMRHYDDQSRVGAVLRAQDGKHGIWVTGALHPSVTDEQIADMKLNPPSGDWRIVNGQHELICGLSVPVPGFPIPRVEMQLVASGGDLQMGALIAALGPEEADHAAVEALVASGALTEEQALDLDHEDAERRLAVLAARAEGIDALLALAEA